MKYEYFEVLANYIRRPYTAIFSVKNHQATLKISNIKDFLTNTNYPLLRKAKRYFGSLSFILISGHLIPLAQSKKNLLAVRFLAFKYLYNNRDFGFLYMLFLKKKVRNKNRTPTSAGPFCNVFVFILIKEMYCILNNRRVKIL